MKARLVKKEKAAENTYTFWLKPEHKLTYIPGQYIELALNIKKIDKRGNKRFFTLSSSPTEENIAITTRLEGYSSSFKKTLSGMKAGNLVDISPPSGDFVLPKDDSQPLVFIAAGIGITPFRSILKFLIDTNQKRNIKLIYGETSVKKLCFKSLIDQSGVEFHPVVGTRMTSEIVMPLTKDLKDPAYFISGPEKMVENLEKALVKSGVNRLQIRCDYFHNY